MRHLILFLFLPAYGHALSDASPPGESVGLEVCLDRPGVLGDSDAPLALRFDVVDEGLYAPYERVLERVSFIRLALQTEDVGALEGSEPRFRVAGSPWFPDDHWSEADSLQLEASQLDLPWNPVWHLEVSASAPTAVSRACLLLVAEGRVVNNGTPMHRPHDDGGHDSDSPQGSGEESGGCALVSGRGAAPALLLLVILTVGCRRRPL